MIDFVVKLLLSRDSWTNCEYNAILVVTDRLMKYTYILLYKEVSTAEELANQLLRAIFTHYRILDKIISDRDKLFISKFWTTIIALLRIKRKLLIAFYPQTDGQIERINQIIEVYLRYYVNYKQDN